MQEDKILRHAVICAGGKGTRIATEYPNIPKALVPVFETPIIIDQIKKLAVHGFEVFHLLLGFKFKDIQSAIEDFSPQLPTNIQIIYHVEDTPLGSGGALLEFREQLPEEFLLVYCDIFFDIDFQSFYRFHSESCADVSMFVHPNDHPYDSDLVRVCVDNKVLEILPHPHLENLDVGNLVNAAVYIVKRFALTRIGYDRLKYDFAQDILPKMLSYGLQIYAYRSPEFAKDMGTFDRLSKIQALYKFRFKSFAKNPVVLLDRDGTINKIQIGSYITKLEDFVLLERAADAIRIIREKGYFIMVVTNQPVIARGDVSVQQLDRIHKKMEYLLGLENAYIDALFYCPHHPEKGFVNEVADLKIECDCRKPSVGLLQQADHYIPIDRDLSWMVGDTRSDIEAGNAFGVNTALLTSDFSEDATAGSRFDDLFDFALRLPHVRDINIEPDPPN